MQVGKISKINKSAEWKTMQVGILGILLLLIMVFAYKSQNLIKVQVGKFLKFDKVCCTIIQQTKVRKHLQFHTAHKYFFFQIFDHSVLNCELRTVHNCNMK